MKMIVTENEYLQKIKSVYTKDETTDEATKEIFSLVEKAVKEYPESAKLWCLRGDLIQIGSSETNYELNDSLESYKKALEIDPSSFEAHESIGFFYDDHLGNYSLAEESFRKAIDLGAGEESYYGLARVLAQLNQTEDALKLLEPDNYIYHNESEIKEIRDEISSGVWLNDEVNKFNED
ncbi:MAG: tetratricopeptide repeat protein [Aridibacter sp.]